MNVTINGKIQSVADNASLNDLITNSLKDCSRVIAEHNGAIVKKDDWPQTPLADGDVIELVSFVGGG